MAHPIYTKQCDEDKIALSQHVYMSAIGAVTTPTWAREFQIHNRNARDIVVTWATSNGGTGTKGIPANGSDMLSLTEDPDEQTFTTLSLSLGLFGSGSISNNSILINFKN